jgi:hypothetical protein
MKLYKVKAIKTIHYKGNPSCTLIKGQIYLIRETNYKSFVDVFDPITFRWHEGAYSHRFDIPVNRPKGPISK